MQLNKINQEFKMKRYINAAVEEALADPCGCNEFNGINLRVIPGMTAEACEAAYYARLDAVNRLYAHLVVESTDIPAHTAEHAIVTRWTGKPQAITAESRAVHSAYLVAARQLVAIFLDDDSKFAAIATAIVAHSRKVRQRAGIDFVKLNEAWLEFHELLARHHRQENDILEYRYLRYVPYPQV
jgi:hypothetical protein